MKTSKELIQELADQGLTQAQIAKKLNCSRENIRQQCNRHNIVIKKRGKSKVQNWYLKYENNSKSCRSCLYKKPTQQNYTILNTINWSYESTKTN